MQHITVTTSAHSQHKDITLLSVKGFIDTNTAPEFEKSFQKALVEKKFNLIVDLRETNYISSVGWGIFIGEIKRIRSHGGNLFLASMSPEVAEAYQLLELESIIKCFPDPDHAVQKGFGRTGSKKVQPKARAAKGSASLPVEKVPEQPREAVVLEAPRVEVFLKRPGFFEKLLKPWKWF